MTVRRDLHALEGTGDVRMVHGGVSLDPGAIARRRLRGRRRTRRASERVAGRAAGLVGPTDTIALDAGADGLALARALPEDFRGSVITHSMPVLQLLDERSRGRPGSSRWAGELLADRHAFVGPTTEAALSQLRARTFFLSPAAVDARGMYARTPAEASVQRSLIEIADRVVLVATREVYATLGAGPDRPAGPADRAGQRPAPPRT